MKSRLGAQYGANKEYIELKTLSIEELKSLQEFEEEQFFIKYDCFCGIVGDHLLFGQLKITALIEVSAISICNYTISAKIKFVENVSIIILDKEEFCIIDKLYNCSDRVLNLLFDEILGSFCKQTDLDNNTIDITEW